MASERPVQLTLRVDRQLVALLKAAASDRGRSVNSWATAVLRAAVDPDLAEDDTARTRARLAAAGLLAAPDEPPVGRPAPRALEEARAAAGRGRPLADYVSEGR